MKHPNDPPPSLSPIMVPRARVLDADKVRYRVYRTPEESVVVIAENALMAMRVAEIPEPFRIERDRLSESFAQPELLEREETPSISLATALPEPVLPLLLTPATMPVATESGPFVPMQLSEFEKKQAKPVRFFTPDMVDALFAKEAREAALTDTSEPESAPQPEPTASQAVPALPLTETPLAPDEVARLLEDEA